LILHFNKDLSRISLLKMNLNINKQVPPRVRWLMGTLCEIRADVPPAAVTAAFEEIGRWERVLSVHDPDSELSALNRLAGLGPARVSDELFVACASALRFARLSGGLFDPTVRLGLAVGGWRQVRLDARERTIALRPHGLALDFGGFGKGWALDRAAFLLKEAGARNALLNFGGQILALGAAEGFAGWPVSIPGAPGPILLRNESVAVSGDCERPGHILSPCDGLPVRRPGSAAAVCRTATEADAWSTPLYVLGRNPGSFQGRSFFDTAAQGGRL
jgi:thiamine biosynthesis lipoprotein